MTTPPPRATTASGRSSPGSVSFSNARNAFSLCVAKISATDMPALSSTRWSRSKKAAWARCATSAPTRVLPAPMKPTSASGLRCAGLDAAWIGRYWCRGRGARRHAAPPPLRLDENLVAEPVRLGQVEEDLRPDLTGRLALHVPV